MENINCNLNIHYTLPDDLWDKIMELYRQMPYFVGFIDNIPYWFSSDENEKSNSKSICASVEPSGLFFSGQLPKDEWTIWISEFKIRATEILGYEVGEPEEGFDFKLY